MSRLKKKVVETALFGFVLAFVISSMVLGTDPTYDYRDFLTDQYGTSLYNWRLILCDIQGDQPGDTVVVAVDTTGDIGQYTFEGLESGYYWLFGCAVWNDSTDTTWQRMQLLDIRVCNVPLSGKVRIGDTLWVDHIVIGSSFSGVDSVMYADSAFYADLAGVAVVAGSSDVAAYAWVTLWADTASNANDFNIDDSCYVGRHLVVGDSAWVDKIIRIPDDYGELQVGMKIGHYGDSDTWISFGDIITDTDEFTVQCGNVDYFNIDQAAKFWHVFLDDDLDFFISTFWGDPAPVRDTVFFIRNSYPCDEWQRGNIGIQNTDPQHALHVTGDMGVDDTLHVGPDYDWQLHVVDSTLYLENSAGDTMVNFWPEMSWWQGPMMLVNADTNDIQTWKGSGAPLQLWVEGGVGVHGDLRVYRSDGSRAGEISGESDTTFVIDLSEDDKLGLYANVAGDRAWGAYFKVNVDSLTGGASRYGVRINASVRTTPDGANQTFSALHSAVIGQEEDPPYRHIYRPIAGYFHATGGSTAVGVYGEAVNAASQNWAGYFASGDVMIEGECTVQGSLHAKADSAANADTAGVWKGAATKVDTCDRWLYRDSWDWFNIGATRYTDQFGDATHPFIALLDTFKLTRIILVGNRLSPGAIVFRVIEGASDTIVVDSLKTAGYFQHILTAADFSDSIFTPDSNLWFSITNPGGFPIPDWDNPGIRFEGYYDGPP